MEKRPQMATLVTWGYAPNWLTIEEACELSGHDLDTMRQIIDVDGVDLNEDGLIEKRSLHDFQESLALVLNWR